MSETFIRCENLSYTYSEDEKSLPALHNLSLSVERGEYVAVLGHNGSGKSTFAKLLNMITDPTGGKLYIDGRDTSAFTTDDEVFDVRRKIGMVFQNPDNQLVATVVEDDVAFGPENLGIPSDEIRRRVDAALETVGMSGFKKSEPHRLSGGQKQRVAIAGILAMEPECMIFDESTSMLDPVGRRELLETVDKLNRDKGITIIMITHYMDEAVRANRVIVLDGGELIADGTPAEVFAEEDKLRGAGLEVPQCMTVMKKLRDAGYKIQGDVTTPEKCADIIGKLYKAKNG